MNYHHPMQKVYEITDSVGYVSSHTGISWLDNIIKLFSYLQIKLHEMKRIQVEKTLSLEFCKK